MYDIGDVVVIEITLKRKTVLTDPDSITVTVKAPDGAMTMPTATKTGTGVYEVEVAATMAGTYHVKVQGTGAAAGVEYGSFLVRQPEF